MRRPSAKQGCGTVRFDGWHRDALAVLGGAQRRQRAGGLQIAAGILMALAELKHRPAVA